MNDWTGSTKPYWSSTRRIENHLQAIELIIVKDKKADVRANLRAKCSKRQHQRFDPYQVQSLIQTSFTATPRHRGRLKPARVFLNELVPDHHLQPQSIHPFNKFNIYRFPLMTSNSFFQILFRNVQRPKTFSISFLVWSFVHFWINFKSMSLTSLAENGIY